MSCYSLVVIAFLWLYLQLQCATGVKVSVEEEFRSYQTSFNLPIIDGDSSIHKLFHSLEVLEREPTDKDRNLEMIMNFPNLININISYFYLQDIPKFLNIPEIELLIFEENEISVIKDNVLSQLPVKELYFSRNKIQKIEDGSFGLNTTEVTLDCNRLTTLSPKWFRSPEVLKVLTMRSNQITLLESNLLSHFKNLKTLNLANNNIIVIGSGALSGPTSMAILSLQGNKLANLPHTVFSGSKNEIKFLNIAMNRLNFLSEFFLDKLTLKRILLLGNPWQCPCLRKIDLWTSHHNISTTLNSMDLMKWSAYNAVCIYALSFRETCIEAVDQELYDAYYENLYFIDRNTYC